VVQLAAGVAKAEHLGGLRAITDYADNGTGGRALPLHFDPRALPWRVSTVAPFVDHAFQARHQRQPVLRLLERGGMSDELEVRAPRRQQQFEARSPIAQPLINEFGSSIPYQVKGEQDRG
jgi:hypothetical protein